MATIKETKEWYKEHYEDIAEIEVYRVNSKVCRGFHTDYISSLDSDEYDEDEEVLYERLMDEYDYNTSILANTCETADFEGWYGDAAAKVLCIAIYQEHRVY